MKELIVRVYQNNASGQMLVTIPKDSGIKTGDFVQIKKLKVGE